MTGLPDRQNFTLLERFLWNFYITDPKRTTFEHDHEVPDYIGDKFSVCILMMIVLEHFILLVLGKEGIRLGDGLTSLSMGSIFRNIFRVALGGAEFYGYHWLYQYRIIDLNWQSAWTWWTAAILTDFGYYWFHRACHEINFIWASHQVHHSSEEYNITTAIRQSAFQKFFNFGIFHPFALVGVPLPAILVHYQFNLIFQIWMHTKLISKLGPFEWIFNTASHHRVHHGTNKWCLDKNYAGVLIIWDRMFGTFQAEKDDEEIVYGLVEQPQRFENFYLQLFYYQKMFKKALSMSTWKDSLKALCYGPGWTPGSPRLGDESALADKTIPRNKYNPKLSFWMKIYIVLNFLITTVATKKFHTMYSTMPGHDSAILITFLFISMFAYGSFYDGQKWAPATEVIRCVGAGVALKGVAGVHLGIHADPSVNTILSGFYALSAVYWSLQVAKSWSNAKMKNL